MSEDARRSIKGDRALASGDEDRLGFREVARRMALSLVDRATEGGLVVGLEGPWGSGKSSLLFLVGEELGRLTGDGRQSVINFRPWLIGNRDALIASLFDEISRQLDAVAARDGDASRANRAKAREAGEALRGFAKGIGKAGAVVRFVGKASGLGLVEMAGEGLQSIGEATGDGAPSASLLELKYRLARSLRELGHRFVVTIDDVDRLEPAEVVEVLRLVRSVVDLPNMVYLLCYDSGILAHSIERAAGVASGRSYLEKIIQLTVMVPRPEPLQLRQWFSDALRRIASTKDEDERSRLDAVIDFEGGRQLRTPRSVVRALDAVRFFWPPLAELRADLADLVWLQLIKDGNAELYRWIEDYCATAAVVSLGTARVEEVERERRLAALLASAEVGYFKDLMYRHRFAQQLPGVQVDHGKDGAGLRIFAGMTDDQRDRAIRDRRLASPDHYRLYFALADPSHVLRQEEFVSTWAAAEAGAEPMGRALLALDASPASGTLTKADLLLERVRGGATEVLSPIQCENLLVAFSQVMDRAHRERPFDLFWVGTLWDRALNLIPLLLSRLGRPRREAVMATMFEAGSSIGWLTSILRHETFAHGRHGDRRRPELEWLFGDDELDRAGAALVARYKAMSMREILSSPSPISLLFAWRQAGDEEGPRRIVDANVASDQGLLETLEGLLSTIRSGDGARFEVLSRHNLDPFTAFDLARQRVDSLASHPDLGERARRLVVAFKDGDRF